MQQELSCFIITMVGIKIVIECFEKLIRRQEKNMTYDPGLSKKR